MPNITAILSEHIRRVSRRAMNTQFGVIRKLTAQHRRDLAALKRQVTALTKTIAFLEAQEKRRVAQQPLPQLAEGIRFRADGLRSHRAKLALSAEDYGRLVGVTGQTIYNWEAGDSRPRPQQIAGIAAVRGIGKREALKRLQLLGQARPQAGNRGSYSQTAQEFILALVKSQKAATSTAINAAWKKSGRPGNANNPLSIMVAAGSLKREKLKGQRGSQYRIA